MLAMLCILSVFFMIAGSDEPVIGMLEGTAWEGWMHKMHIGNSVVFGMATGVFSGLVVWFFAVYIPERAKRKILKTNLSNQYRYFRENVLRIFLFAVHGHANSAEMADLQDHRKFKKFFGKNNSQHWYTVVNWLPNNEYYFQAILHEMEFLSRESMYVLNNCNIQDKKVHDFLSGLSAMALMHKRADSQHDSDLKPLMRLLWSIFAQWNFSDGQHEEDPIQKMIDRI